MKTPEEIKAAVLKVCERLCPKPETGVEIGKKMSIYRPSSDLWIIETERWTGQNDVICSVSLDIPEHDDNWQLAYRLLNIEANELRLQLEEAKIYRFKTMEEPAFQVMGEFANFLNEAVEADCPMITHWGVKVQETGEDIEILNIWAATTHDSPITRCKELRREIDSLQERAQGLVDALEFIKTLQNGKYTPDWHSMVTTADNALNQWKGGGK